MLVLVTGLPGSGKTTLAAPLAAKLDLPLIAKDRFKELLFDVLGTGDLEWSRRIGQAAIMLQYDAMATIKSAVVDSALWTGFSEPEIEALGLPVVQLYCQCPFEVARGRFFSRVEQGHRHRGYREDQMTYDHYERFRPLVNPLRLKAPLVCADTTAPIDVDATAAALRAAARTLEVLGTGRTQ
jgi:predicted kinase